MAHTPRHKDEKRAHPGLYPINAKVGTYADGGLVTGKVYSYDEGGWIYVEWAKNSEHLPGYLRSTQVFLLE